MEYLFKPLELAQQLSTQLLTLSTGILAASTALVDKVSLAKTSRQVQYLKAAWCAYLGSVLLGVGVLQALVGNAAVALGASEERLSCYRCEVSVSIVGPTVSPTPTAPVAKPGPVADPCAGPCAAFRHFSVARTPSPYESNVLIFATGQYLLFLIGMGLMVAFGVAATGPQRTKSWQPRKLKRPHLLWPRRHVSKPTIPPLQP